MFYHQWLPVFLACTLSLQAAPHWNRPADNKQGFHLGYSFQLPEGIKSAHLRLVADFANLELAINGRKTAVCEMFGPVIEMDGRAWLHAGKNEITLRPYSPLKHPVPGDKGSGQQEMAKVRLVSEDAVVALELVNTDD